MVRNENLDRCAVFILTHRRPDKVKTYSTLRKSGYTGQIYIIVDDEDPSLPEYKKTYGSEVIVFDKKKSFESTDSLDNFPEMNTVLYARNATPLIAHKLGLDYHLDLDDDYSDFMYKFDGKGFYRHYNTSKLDQCISELIKFMDSAHIVDCICMSQTGDYIGGQNSGMAAALKLTRKSMNSFLRRSARPFKYLSRMNDDVTTYVNNQYSGNNLFLTINQLCLMQKPTQQNTGGLTDMYLQYGTYNKSMYTVICNPSCAKICCLNSSNPRIHHRINWNRTTPKILNPRHRKARV